MQNQSSLTGDQAAQVPPMAPVQVQSGLSTSSGQFTAIFALAAIILSAVGFHYSPAQIEGWAQAANNFLTTLGPLLAIIPVLIGYINSRGKIQSNAIMAQAHIATGVPAGVVSVESQFAPLMGSKLSAEKVLGAVPDIIGVAGSIQHGGKGSFKDPNTYGQLLNIATELGVPGAAQADAVNQQLHPAELITGILSLFHHKQKATPPTH